MESFIEIGDIKKSLSHFQSSVKIPFDEKSFQKWSRCSGRVKQPPFLNFLEFQLFQLLEFQIQRDGVQLKYFGVQSISKLIQSHFIILFRDAVTKKNGIMWEKFPSGRSPPPPPHRLGTTCGFYYSF